MSKTIRHPGGSTITGGSSEREATPRGKKCRGETTREGKCRGRIVVSWGPVCGMSGWREEGTKRERRTHLGGRVGEKLRNLGLGGYLNPQASNGPKDQNLKSIKKVLVISLRALH